MVGPRKVESQMAEGKKAENHEFCMNLNFLIFLEILAVFGHLIIRPDFFRPLFIRPFVLRPLASLPVKYQNIWYGKFLLICEILGFTTKGRKLIGPNHKRPKNSRISNGQRNLGRISSTNRWTKKLW
jgi:hypothetical protein